MSPLLTKGGVILAKILKNGILSVIMTMVILTLSPLTAFSQEYEPRLTAPQGEPYYTSKLNVYSQTDMVCQTVSHTLTAGYMN